MKILKDSFIYLAGELVSKIMPFLLLPYISRKLGVEGYGELSYYQTFAALFAIFISLSQDGAVTRYFYTYGHRSLDLIVKSGHIYSVLLGFIFIIFAISYNAHILLYIILNSILGSFISVQLAIRQCQKRVHSYISIQIFGSFISTIVTIITLEIYTQNLVEKRIISSLLANILILIFAYYFYNKKILYKNISWKIKKYKIGILYLLGFGIPLVLHHTSGFIKGQIDRVFIYHKFTDADLGLYSMGAQLSSVLMICIMAINKATIPYIFDSLKNKRITIRDIHKYFYLSLLLIPIPVLMIHFIPESLFVWVLGDAFWGVKYYFLSFSISTVLFIPYMLLVNYLFYYGKNKLISYSSILSVLSYLILLFYLINTKISYIPFASIFGSSIVLPILYYFTNKVSKEKE
ncbi:flippase [Canicola haemoglobinophilus]|uniref:Lipooligosaccharide flippase n=1 Tax=Canicola haemoglobinophilus TaxID=733 RepID=A0A1V4AZ23_9PAST|nr:oligosaccharide flippase family protein [Canicola haemoglobinophilus]OOR98095.1 flippase [Canicola haemoglobinophilus]STO55297.1 putative lipooligosaccharide flippase [Canicola haemoglobinophilus]STO59397.1 putative lipooligosaccharide flippase [Canicola haemoglobinophilus]STO69133.1 putative lipooligosaccharide flippase [Canicola haemoglobinophilus]